jgi:uncharacterized SAM-binding protein YcdF (DUF218 family)
MLQQTMTGHPFTAHKMPRFVVAAACAMVVAAGATWGLAKSALRQEAYYRSGETADALLVPSGDFGNLRTRRAVELLEAGVAPVLLISGAGVAGDSADYLASVAERLGAPPEKILREGHARSTYENMVNARPLLTERGVRKVIVVTSDYHARRAGLVARYVLQPMDVVVEPVPMPKSIAPASIVEGLKTLRYAVLGYLPWSMAFGG